MLNVARLKEYHICVALRLVTLEKPAWRNSIVMDFEVILIMNHLTLATFLWKSEVTKIPFTGHKERATNLLVIIHYDVCSPIKVIASSGFVYLQK